MKIFIDTAKIDEIKRVSNFIDGVTTNPSLIKEAVSELKMKIEMEDFIKKICETAGKNKPVSLEVVSLTEKEMIEEAKLLFNKFNNIANNIVIKIPISTFNEKLQPSHYNGLNVIKELNNQSIPVNATLIMTPEQAILAAKLGARYTSPFVGRIDDFIRKSIGLKFEKSDYFPADGMKDYHDNGIYSGVDLIEKIIKIYKNYKFKTEVIAASIRNSRQVREVALAGAHIVTIPFKTLEEMIKHPKTLEGVIKFSEDTIPEYKDIFAK